MEPAGARWLTPGLSKCKCVSHLIQPSSKCQWDAGSVTAACSPSDFYQLTIITRTVNRHLQLSDGNSKVTYVEEDQLYPDQPDRFEVPQLLCEPAPTGRAYWEVEWGGTVYISVSYGQMGQRRDRDIVFGWDDQSWSLCCSDAGYSACHNNRKTSISSNSPASNRVAVYVDCPAGVLSFYEKVSSGSLVHLHTFNNTFTQTLYPGFAVWSLHSSVFVC